MSSMISFWKKKKLASVLHWIAISYGLVNRNELSISKINYSNFLHLHSLGISMRLATIGKIILGKLILCIDTFQF